MTSYQFTLDVESPSTLSASILASSISSTFDHLDTIGSGTSMSVNIWFTSDLSSADQSTLSNIVNAYVNPVVTQDMITSITNSIATDANLMMVIRAKVNMTLPTMNYQQIKTIMTILGLS